MSRNVWVRGRRLGERRQGIKGPQRVLGEGKAFKMTRHRSSLQVVSPLLSRSLCPGMKSAARMRCFGGGTGPPGYLEDSDISGCVSICPTAVQNPNIAIKNWSWRQLNLEKPLKYRCHDVTICRYIDTLQRCHGNTLFAFARQRTWRRGSHDQITSSTGVFGGGDRIFSLNKQSRR